MAFWQFSVRASNDVGHELPECFFIVAVLCQ